MSASKKIQGDLILLLAAAIWGFAFVAQRVGMDYLGPFTFTAIRFTLGSLFLLPWIFFRNDKAYKDNEISSKEKKKIRSYQVILGLILFGGISFQQYGLQYTTAGNAGLLTGLYVIFIPVIGILRGNKMRNAIWIGALLSISGLYFLSVRENFTMNFGDSLILVCAFFWTAHVILVGYLAPRTDPVRTAVIQFIICALLSWIPALIFEKISIGPVLGAVWPLLYGGILSVGVAYTLQVIAQQRAHPAYASIILSLEAVFAVIGGWLILDEPLTLRILAGCILMLAGMFVVQFRGDNIPA